MSGVVLPFHANTCRNCLGIERRSTCVECAGSGVIRADAAMREHWGFGRGMRDHGIGLGLRASPFGRGSFADRCWRAGWLRAERDEIAQSYADKLENERCYGVLT